MTTKKLFGFASSQSSYKKHFVHERHEIFKCLNMIKSNHSVPRNYRSHALRSSLYTNIGKLAKQRSSYNWKRCCLINLRILNNSGSEIATKASLPQGGGCSVGAIPRSRFRSRERWATKNGIEASLAKITKQ